LRITWKQAVSLTLEQGISKLNKQALGWGNYYRHYVSKRAYSDLDN